MLDFSDIQQQPVHAQLLAFADANLESAEALCERLCAEPKSATYAHGAVVMSLAFHSLELFFKAGVRKLQPQERFAGRSGHDMDALSKRFFRLYPKKEFQFELPFRRKLPKVVDGITDSEFAALRSYVEERNRQVPEDQRNRYPINVEGAPWPHANFGFEPNMFLATIQELKTVYARLRPLLNAS